MSSNPRAARVQRMGIYPRAVDAQWKDVNLRIVARKWTYIYSRGVDAQQADANFEGCREAANEC